MATPTVEETSMMPESDLPRADATRTAVVCVAGALIPGLGHAILHKWDRAAVFFGCIAMMIIVGIQFDGCLVPPELPDIFGTLKFFANVGAGLFYWIPWLFGAGTGDPTSYTHDFGNVFVYAAGLLNMLTIIDVFDIARGRKQ